MMNIQELIKEFEEIGIHGLNMFGTVVKGIPTETAIKLIKQLDERQPVKVPPFVADWINHSRNTGCSLFGAMSIFEENIEIKKWMQWAENQETFARAWLDGYEVEKEKRYHIRLKGLKKGCNCLNHDTKKDEWNFMSKYGIGKFRTAHTRKQLEEAGFGWVFDCEGVDIEEVE